MCDEKREKHGVVIERLKELIDTKTREEIAKALGCDTSLITKHYNGNREVTVDYVVKYAQYFNVTTDYLLGLTDAKTPVDTYDNKIIRSMCDYTGLSEEAIEELYQSNSCFLPAEMGYISNIIKCDIFSLIEYLTAYDVALYTTTKFARENIKALKEAIDKKTKYTEAMSINKNLDKDYTFFLLHEKLKEFIHNCFKESEKECDEAVKEENNLYRLYMKEVVNNANNNETE